MKLSSFGLNSATPRIAALLVGSVALCVICISSALPEMSTEEYVTSQGWKASAVARSNVIDETVEQLPAPRIDVLATAEHRIRTTIEDVTSQVQAYATSMTVSLRSTSLALPSESRLLRRQATKVTAEEMADLLVKHGKRIDQKTAKDKVKLVCDNVDLASFAADKKEKDTIRYKLKEKASPKLSTADFRDVCNQVLTKLTTTVEEDDFPKLWPDKKPPFEFKPEEAPNGGGGSGGSGSTSGSCTGIIINPCGCWGGGTIIYSQPTYHLSSGSCVGGTTWHVLPRVYHTPTVTHACPTPAVTHCPTPVTHCQPAAPVWHVLPRIEHPTTPCPTTPVHCPPTPCHTPCHKPAMSHPCATTHAVSHAPVVAHHSWGCRTWR